MELVRRFESRHWGWWYLSIGIGFLLLGIVHLLDGAGFAAFALRIGVAAGFGILSWMQFHYGR
jgi:hypothetical protein